MVTSKRIAKKASRELRSSRSSRNERSVAGSDLSQARKPPIRKKKKR